MGPVEMERLKMCIRGSEIEQVVDLSSGEVIPSRQDVQIERGAR